MLSNVPEGILLGADTIVVCDGEILGKPRDAEHALRMLQRLNGRGNEVQWLKFTEKILGGTAKKVRVFGKERVLGYTLAIKRT
ncbi:MAG: hypothetical protein C4335_11960, partial [Armatimonadota bacterium]